ncbi:HepT-like ribonuclease domain-containing protein [uncultured Parabacteroides sp.]|jgi:uncharacterized protein with HEPN domain|nr:HepT-like ribonuclease domain-containing protein [uncultured Parabacteroides sp.]
MFDKGLILHTLGQIDNSLQIILERTSEIAMADDFLLSSSGMTLLDSVCMKLIAVGESVKNLDKLTNKELLPIYSEIPWKRVMGVRDIIVHHYFDVDADEIFHICKNDIPILHAVIKRMITDLN